MPETILVIGGGPAGLEAARAIATIGGQALLLERRPVLGGTPDESNYAALTPRMGSAQDALEAPTAQARLRFYPGVNRDGQRVADWAGYGQRPLN